jgi:hypothetical protein
MGLRGAGPGTLRKDDEMTKIVFAAVFLLAFYAAWQAVQRAAQRQREAFARARPQNRMEPRDLGTLRDGGDGIYVPDHSRRD